MAAQATIPMLDGLQTDHGIHPVFTSNCSQNLTYEGDTMRLHCCQKSFPGTPKQGHGDNKDRDAPQKAYSVPGQLQSIRSNKMQAESEQPGLNPQTYGGEEEVTSDPAGYCPSEDANCSSVDWHQDELTSEQPEITTGAQSPENAASQHSFIVGNFKSTLNDLHLPNEVANTSGSSDVPPRESLNASGIEDHQSQQPIDFTSPGTWTEWPEYERNSSRLWYLKGNTFSLVSETPCLSDHMRRRIEKKRPVAFIVKPNSALSHGTAHKVQIIREEVHTESRSTISPYNDSNSDAYQSDSSLGFSGRFKTGIIPESSVDPQPGPSGMQTYTGLADHFLPSMLDELYDTDDSMEFEESKNTNKKGKGISGKNSHETSDGYTAKCDSQVRKRTIWEFLLVLLSKPRRFSKVVAWTDKEKGEFMILDTKQLAKEWSRTAKKPIEYTSFARNLRNHKDKLEKVAHTKLKYRFLEGSGWRTFQVDSDKGTTAELWHASKIHCKKKKS